MSQRVIEPILITERERRWNAREIDVEVLARWMDSVFVIPGTGIRFGLDALVGLIPGLGDTLTSFVSLYILKVASLRGVPRVVLARMALNIAIDYLLGTVPVVGDAFDIYWKANLKNVELLRRHSLAGPSSAHRANWGDWLFVAGLMALLVALLVGCITIAYWIVSSMWHLVAGN
jgi:hypothetical protein